MASVEVNSGPTYVNQKIDSTYTFLHSCLKTLDSECQNEGFLKVGEAILWFLAQNIKKQQK